MHACLDHILLFAAQVQGINFFNKKSANDAFLPCLILYIIMFHGF